jgi:hypothetical protein
MVGKDLQMLGLGFYDTGVGTENPHSIKKGGGIPKII